MSEESNPLRHLNLVEQACVRRYVSLLAEKLGDKLLEVRLFGSAARGDMWAEDFPVHSDIDLLVLTHEPLPAKVRDELLNETYFLYLECGRQIAPQWRTVEQFRHPQDESAKEFTARVEAEGQTLY